MSIKIFLIRHGATDFHMNHRYCSYSDIDLNDIGRLQAERLFHRLDKERINKIYCSDMKRAFNFARLVFKDENIEKTPQLREINFGIFEGLTYQEIMNKYPQLYRKWLKDPVGTVIPKGESLNELNRRVKDFLSKILKKDIHKKIVIVTHAGVIRVILCKILNLKLKDIFSIKQDLACLNIVEFDKGKVKIHLINDTSHLNG